MVELVELKSGAARVAGPGRVLKAAEAARLLATDDIRAAAEAEAAALVDAARAEAEAIREAARREGHATAESQVQDLLFQIAENSIAAIERTEERIVELGIEVARRVIGDLDPAEVAARTALRGMGLAARSGFVRLRVAPELVNAVGARVRELQPANQAAVPVEVIADPQVPAPGAVLETDTGMIDATIDSQLEALRRALARRLGRSAPAGAAA